MPPSAIDTFREMDDEFMTVAEIAAILKLNQQTIRNWIAAGTLPAVRLGERRVRVFRSDFDVLVGNSTTGHQPTATPERSDGIWGGYIPPPIVPDG